MTQIKAHVDFSHCHRTWDGFGVNYVETCQTQDYTTNPQDYGGFSTLDGEARQKILDLIFGAGGLKPGIIKMFFDPFHQSSENRNPAEPYLIDSTCYDHATTSWWTRYFAREGLARTRSDGRNLSIVTTLYGPPGFMTKQGFVRGRDLDPACWVELSKYFTDWVRYLCNVEALPIRHVSLHNEGEDFARWPEEGSTPMWEEGHDYNLYWPPEQVCDFVILLRKQLDGNGLADVSVTPGETTNWFRFSEWGYADALAENPQALAAIGLVTSHGFLDSKKRWYGDARSTGIDLLREKRPDLHAWSTSISWSKMDVHFLNEIRHNIYGSKVNAIIPWACIQWSSNWAKGDPNPGTAFRVDGKGGYSVEPGYYFYKQLSRAGQPGTGVCKVTCNDTELPFLAFSDHGSGCGDTFVVLNTSMDDKTCDILISGALTAQYDAWRTGPGENYIPLGRYPVTDNHIRYMAPSGSATTFFGRRPL